MNYLLGSNFLNACRTCLSENMAMKSVFSYETIMEQQTSLCDMLMSCASVMIEKGDGLPESICVNCSQEIGRAFLFRKLCEKSDMTLRDYLNTINTLGSATSEKHNMGQNQVGKMDKMEIKDDDLIVAVASNVLLPEWNSLNDSKQAEIVLPNASQNKATEQSCIVDKIEESENVLDDLTSNRIDSSDENLDTEHSGQYNTRKVRKRKVKSNKSISDYVHCQKCDAKMSTFDEYQQHLKNFHNQSTYSCSNCGKIFKSENSLLRHASNHCGEPKKYKGKTGVVKKRNLPRTCEICNKTFRFHSNLERHKLVHTGEKPFLCNVCGKGFAQLTYLKIHSFIHTGEKPYKCQLCDKSFAAPGTLMTHIRTHTGERPHICKICGKDFPQSGYLAAHIRTHTGEKPVECKVCGRRFNQSGRLIVHMRIHSGEKPYACKECGRSFAVKGTLKKHIRTHTGERPYVCSVCGQAFAQSGTLSTHMKLHKPKEAPAS